MPFYLPSSPKNTNFKKLKKAPGNIIILHKFTKSYDHMLYCSWDMARYVCNCYFSFWAIFCPFDPNSPKNKNFEGMKKHLEISSFYTSVPKIMIICHTVPEIWCVTGVIVIFHFGLFFALLHPCSPKNKNFKKMKKNPRRFHHFIHVYQHLWLDDDGRKKWHIEVGTPPKKNKNISWHVMTLKTLLTWRL